MQPARERACGHPDPGVGLPLPTARLERSLFGLAPRHTPSGSIELVPIESLGSREVPFAVAPPWLKRVYLDPEYAATD